MLASCLVGSRLTACHYSSTCRTTEVSIYQQGRQPIKCHHVLSMAEVETAEPKASTRFWYQEYMHLSQPTRHIKATREEKRLIRTNNEIRGCINTRNALADRHLHPSNRSTGSVEST